MRCARGRQRPGSEHWYFISSALAVGGWGGRVDKGQNGKEGRTHAERVDDIVEGELSDEGVELEQQGERLADPT